MECLHEELFVCKPNYVRYLIVKSKAELLESCFTYVHTFQVVENLIELLTQCLIDDFRLLWGFIADDNPVLGDGRAWKWAVLSMH